MLFSKTEALPPMDAQMREERRQRVESLTERVRGFCRGGDFTSDSQADLDVESLAWEVGGMARFVHATAVSDLGEEAANFLVRGWFTRSLGEVAEARAVREFGRLGVDNLAQRSRELNGLCMDAQRQLDALIMRNQPLQGEAVQVQLMSAVLDAEDRGDRVAIRDAQALMEAHAGPLGALWQLDLARARRDRLRRAMLRAAQQRVLAPAPAAPAPVPVRADVPVAPGAPVSRAPEPAVVAAPAAVAAPVQPVQPVEPVVVPAPAAAEAQAPVEPQPEAQAEGPAEPQAAAEQDAPAQAAGEGDGDAQGDEPEAALEPVAVPTEPVASLLIVHSLHSECGVCGYGAGGEGELGELTPESEECPQCLVHFTGVQDRSLAELTGAAV